jgi:hypothetical protein
MEPFQEKVVHMIVQLEEEKKIMAEEKTECVTMIHKEGNL